MRGPIRNPRVIFRAGRSCYHPHHSGKAAQVRQKEHSMRRRMLLLVGLVALTGCGCGSRAAGNGRKPAAGNRPKGPKTMGKLLVKGYIADLENGSTESRIAAARELANMGGAAKAALPALQPLTKHADAKLSAAAGEAITAIKRALGK